MKLLIVALHFFLAFSLHAKTNVTVMSYNVENLFDSEHDAGKQDWGYLPLDVKRDSDEIMQYCRTQSGYNRDFCFNVDWNQENLQIKLDQIAKVVLSYNHGMGADILFFSEVENKNVLNMLMDTLNGQLPQSAQYKKAVLIEGPDVRGIDPGVITRFEVTEAKNHHIDLSDIDPDYETRNILEVQIKIEDKKVALFANHWPSQANVDRARFLASQVLLAQANRAATETDLVIATGDFNTLEGERPSGIELNILPNFYDAKTEKKDRGFPVFEGTHYYRGEWSNLDRMFILKGHSADIEPQWQNFEIWFEDFMLQNRKKKGSIIPLRYDFFNNSGFSDHFPIVMQFSL